MASLLELYLQVPQENRNALVMKLPKALNEGRIEDCRDVLKQFFASIPYKLIGKMENYYQTVVHIVFSMFGLSCHSEVRTAAGCIDALVETKNFVYCFEFKVDKSADKALAQIDSKEYLLPWKGGGKQLFKVGVNFNTKKKNIDDFKYAVEER
jgi:hypothetical protein